MTVLAERSRSAYADLAALYDLWVADSRYRAWLVGLVGLAREHGLAGARVLDVGCGTGLSTVPLLELGLDVTACDPAPEMLAQAELKIGQRATLVDAGLPRLPVLGEFDLVLAANDVINHVLDAERLCDAVASMAANLATHGLLLLDASTLATYRGLFAISHCREARDAVFVWRGMAPRDFAPGALAEGVLDAFSCEPGGSWRRISSRFVQRHHPHAELMEAFDRADLEVLAVLGQHGDGRRDPHVDELEHIKRVYVARRP